MQLRFLNGKLILLRNRVKVLEVLFTLLAQESIAHVAVDEVDGIADLEEVGYQPSFTRLAASVSTKLDPTIDPLSYLCQNLASTLRLRPQLEGAIISGFQDPQQASNLSQQIREKASGVQR